jgi:hypothetical protein
MSPQFPWGISHSQTLRITSQSWRQHIPKHPCSIGFLLKCPLCFLKIQRTNLLLIEGDNEPYPILHLVHLINKICHVDKYTFGTYKNKVIHTLTFCL